MKKIIYSLIGLVFGAFAGGNINPSILFYSDDTGINATGRFIKYSFIIVFGLLGTYIGYKIGSEKPKNKSS